MQTKRRQIQRKRNQHIITGLVFQHFEIMLQVGDTGSGKSSTGNTILGNLVFPVAKGLKTETKKAKAQTVGNMTVIDTPTITLEMTDEDAEVQSKEWLKEAGVIPNAIVLTINCMNRFTPEEYKLYCRYKSLFRNIIESKLLVVFTRGDLITSEESFNPGEVDNLKIIINDAGERYFIYNNKTQDYAQQNKNLLTVLKAISKKNVIEKVEDLRECDNCMLPMEDGPTKSDMSSPRKDRRVLLVIGKSGTGKSSTGNIILGKRHFCTARGFKTRTHKAQMYRNEEFEIIDTPDIPLKMTQKQAEEEMKSWLDKASAIPNAVLLTINAAEEYSHEDVEIFKRLKDLLERRNVCDNLVIVFTRGDLIDRLDIENSLTHPGDPINVVLKAACGRYVIFDNKTEDKIKKREQMKSLSEKIELSPKRRSLKKEQAADSVPTQPTITSRNSEETIVSFNPQTACQCTPSLNEQSTTSSSSEDEIRVLVMGAKRKTGDKREKCDKKDCRREAESRIFTALNCTLLSDGLVTAENGNQEILHCSNPDLHTVLLVAATNDIFSKAHNEAFDCFVNMLSKHIQKFIIIFILHSESSDEIDQTGICERIKEKLQSTNRKLTVTNDKYRPLKVTNKPDMNEQMCEVFQWIMSKGHFFDNNEAPKVIQKSEKNTELSRQQQSTDSRKNSHIPHRSNSEEQKIRHEQNQRNCACHIQ